MGAAGLPPEARALLYDGEYITEDETEELTAMLRVMVRHGGPPESLAILLAPPLQQIVQDGARLRAPRVARRRARRRALLNVHCPLLPPLTAIVRDYDEIDDLWGLEAPRFHGRPSRCNCCIVS
jgi:hypothetical protein